ncbi:MAG: HpcH/HpaI aldolase family protein [Aestuariivirga sp.]|jgi:4-hydroxy-2-oxoheptanedioate aldolase|uniref:HpcH/HpaI aldolase family protein n=1 Tax=Aestuariivirga sp. TaxID=2650926 RepID=UPI0038D166D4
MARNNIRRLWAEAKPAVNGWLSVGNPFTAEIMAQQGYDAVTVDQQHGFLGYDALAPMLQAVKASPATPMVRVPWLAAGDIMKALDAGALGIICPMINNREEAERFVSYMRYPPNGQRSMGPTRAVFAHGADYSAWADQEVIALAMIETADGMKNLDAIVSTPGLDGVYIGPADLTLGLTGRKYPVGFDREEPEIVDAIKLVLGKSHAAGIKACLHCGTPAYAARAIGWGFDLVTLSNDVRLLAGAAKASVDSTRKLIGEQVAAEAAPKNSGY